MDQDNKNEVVEAFHASLKDLWCNSKVMIQILTQMAAESIEYAEDVFTVIKIRLQEVPAAKTKFAILCLIDSIIKNVRGSYKTIFCKTMVSILPEVYAQVDEGCQKQILKLRQTWTKFCSQAFLNILDINMQIVDSSWPVAKTSAPSTSVLPDQGTHSVDSTVFGLQNRILEIQRELTEIKKEKYKLDYAEAQLMLQATSMQNTNPSANKLQTIEENTSNLINDVPKMNISIQDPLLLNHQHTNVDSITPEVQCSEAFNWANNPPHDCSSIMVTRNETTRGTKRRYPETEEAGFYKKIKDDISNRPRGKADIKELRDLRNGGQSSEENKENCANGSIPKKDQGIDVHKLFDRLLSNGMINNSTKATPQILNHPLSVIQAQGKQCHQCGIQFSSEQTVQFRKHLDWHVQQKCKAKRKKFPKKEQSSSQFPNFADSKSLKIRTSSLIEKLYQGQQCGTCGERFPSGQSNNYREHLDWHFRQNRKVKVTKRSQRSWYYSVSDWMSYHEEPEQKENNYFELQKLVEDADASPKSIVPCVRSDVGNTHCAVCHDNLKNFMTILKTSGDFVWRFGWIIKFITLLVIKTSRLVVVVDYFKKENLRNAILYTDYRDCEINIRPCIVIQCNTPFLTIVQVRCFQI